MSRFYINGTTEKDAVRYKPDGDIVFNLALYNELGECVPCPYFHYSLCGDDGVCREDTVSGESGRLTVKTALSCPGFVRLTVTALDADKNRLPDSEEYNGGAGAEPEKLTEALPEPDDFDSVWAGHLAKLKTIAPTVLEKRETDSGDPDYVAYDMKIRTLGKMPVSGILTVPRYAQAGSLKGELGFLGYGGRSARVECRDGTAFFHINGHGYENMREDSYYTDFEEAHEGFGLCDAGKPFDEFYFYYMIMRDTQAARYLLSLPEYGGGGISLQGQSMGAMRATAVAHLIGDSASSLTVSIPWHGDLGAVSRGRQGREFGVNLLTSGSNYQYFDTAYHVKRVKCPVTVARANLGDYISPPSSASVIYNNAPVKRQITYVQNAIHGGCPAGVDGDKYFIYG